jgi:hypothetical protein
MDHDKPVKPKRRWFQFGLKSLFALPVVIGLPLALYVYWADWTQNRPPYKDSPRTSSKSFLHPSWERE